ncbi:MAG: UDP-N-acetyl-D-glucosamine dehydrogenase [Phycisphaerales bacterium]|jgi:UDP-N-acetyl-D-glucosamine dehydrogenase
MPAASDSLQSRIDDRSITVAVIGLGYVGLPLAAAFARAGINTIGYDTDPAKIEALQAGRDYLTHLGSTFAADLLATGRFTPTADIADLDGSTEDPSRRGGADAILICVPTPLHADRTPDLSAVENTAKSLAAALTTPHATPHTSPHAPPRERLVSLESTVYPGVTRNTLAPILKPIPGATYVAYSPERENPAPAGSDAPQTTAIPKLVAGLTPEATDLARAVYGLAFKTLVPCASPEIAESAKLLENVYRAVNIALVNEFKMTLIDLGIDPHAVIEAAATKPFGFARFDPGPGLGGHCIPIDPYYLAHVAKDTPHPARFVELAGQTNHDMPAYVVQRTEGALAARNTPLSSARVLVLGLAYKKNIDDVRESPAFVIIEKLRAAGAQVSYHDPHVPRTHPMRHYDIDMESVGLTREAVESTDAVIIVTDHDAIDYQLLADHAGLIIDTRNAMSRIASPKAAIVKA